MSTYTDASLIVTPNAKKAGKLYALKGADLDVVRATTATYVGSDGLIKTALANEVRFDYSNGSCPSILVEPQRTNLVLRSQEFDNASWIKTRSVASANTTISPSGVQDAETITEGIFTNNFSGLEQAIMVVNGTTYTQSVFVKKGNIDFFGISYTIIGGSTGRVIYNLNTKLVTFSSNITSSSITDFTNGWMRISITYTANASNNNYLTFFHTKNSSSINYNGNGTGFTQIWGAQLEQGSNETSYIPTVASAVTRNDDLISKNGISNLIGQTEGTIYWEGIASYGTAPYYNIFSILRNVDYSKLIYLGIEADGKITIVSQTVNYENALVSIPLNQKSKIALRYKDNDWALYLNGVLVWSKVALVSSGTFDIVEEQYGGGYLSPNRVSAHVLYKTALTNDELAVLTTL